MRMQNSLPLNNINTFAAAAEKLSFQQAAEVLFVTPSAVSHQIRNLEQILGYKLFERLDKKVRLTPQGERLFNDIKRPIKQLQEASRKALRGSEANTLALSIAPLFATGWYLRRLKDFQRSHPEINLTVMASSEVIDFNTDPYDAAIRMGNGDWDEPYIHNLFNCEIVPVCHPSLLAKREKLFTPVEVSNFALVNNYSLVGLWNEWFESADIQLPAEIDFAIEVQNSAQVIEVLQTSDSIGFVDKNFIENDLKSGRLAIACEHTLKSNIGYYLVAPKVTESLPAFQVFKNWLDEQLEKSD